MSVIAAAILISCGGKNSNSANGEETTKNKEAVIADCNCHEIEDEYGTNLAGNETREYTKGLKKKDAKDLFSGTCVEKDQHDSIIKTVVVKNGWLIQQTLREKLGAKYRTKMDMKYDKLEYFDGFILEVDGLHTALENKYNYFKKYVQYEKGEELNKWFVNINSPRNISEYNTNNVKAIWGNKNGISMGLIVGIEAKPNCLVNPEISDGFFEMKDISPEEQIKTLNCLKEEFPRFDYWEE